MFPTNTCMYIPLTHLINRVIPNRALQAKQFLPPSIAEHEQEDNETAQGCTCDKGPKDVVHVKPWARDVHGEYPYYESVYSYCKGCNGQQKLELNEFISLVVKLDVDIIFCVINIFPHLVMPHDKRK